ncbi:cysteine--tRNA ligase [Rhodophyticola sp. CCM32]|uniref:cysteine--tRNA ligase n=1 Tax=Rhodophyticola sp. CCM32 TaxID=2916397 RepID=UPI00107F862B|nr:cysteine--tRNA ligase [Rhodophyticola sp. CCM32]QBY00633.1 cysteine--tRNA ligase [Rhodophyticola sp. CCM32]
MVEIRLKNTRTRQVERFEPLDPENLRMYVCGPTVYDRAHLGNARPVVVFDVLFRLLRHVYGADHVTYVRNFTDVEDKINARAAETGRAISEITEETIGWYLEDMAALGAREPTEMPRATDFIPQMVAMIADLVAKGHAYEAEGHVLFRVRSYGDYGTLSGRSVDDMIAGARVEVAPYKEDPMDFVLWKPSTPDLPGWDSPWGRGRPGWHIECSAMARELLGESFDIHGGGIDLAFPHHENEIAQSACAHPGGDFARIWMHNEMLQVEGRKMSKSLGNFFTVRDLLDQGVPGEVIRFVLLSTHYSKPMNWTEKKREEAEKTLRKWRKQVKDVPLDLSKECATDALADDLNISEVYMRMHSLSDQNSLAALKATGHMIGILNDDLEDWMHEDQHEYALISKLIDIRNSARAVKDFETSDRVRDGLEAIGIIGRDTSEGFTFEIDTGPAHRAVTQGMFPENGELMAYGVKRLSQWRQARLQEMLESLQ